MAKSTKQPCVGSGCGCKKGSSIGYKGFGVNKSKKGKKDKKGKKGKKSKVDVQKIPSIVGRGLIDGQAARFLEIAKIQIMKKITKHADKLVAAGQMAGFAPEDVKAISQIRSMLVDAKAEKDYTIDVAEAYKIAQLSLPLLRKIFGAIKKIKA